MREPGAGRRRWALVLASAAAALVVVEAVVVVTGLDVTILEPLLYRVEGGGEYGGTELYRNSPDAERIYELIPRTVVAAEELTHPKETKYPKRADGRRYTRITVNNLGFRDARDRDRVKPPGVFRIIAFGGSNVFGFSVSDEDTYPALMERLLNERYPGRFEVWNGGINAYVLSQKVAYAKEAVRLYDPDLLVISHENVGRRAFRYDERDPLRFFRENRDLCRENVPFGLFGRFDDSLIRRWGGYRLAMICAYRTAVGWNVAPFMGGPSTTSEFADRRGRESLEGFLKRKDRPPVALLGGPHGPHGYLRMLRGAVYIDLPRELKKAEQDRDPSAEVFTHIHPPSYVYQLYAKVMVRELARRGLLPPFVRPSEEP